jgi:hypothetical protein
MPEGACSNIGIEAYDGSNYAMLWFSITETTSSGATNDQDLRNSIAQRLAVASPYQFQPSVIGSAGRAVAFSIRNKPTWASFSVATGLLAGTPNSTQTGVYSNITVSASDGVTSSSLPAFSYG